jgi:hypothetical protein
LFIPLPPLWFTHKPLNGPQPSGSILENIVNTELLAISVKLQNIPST